MKKYIFVDHINPNIKKEVIGYGYSMLPNGSYQVKESCFHSEIVNCKQFYLARVEVL